MKFFVPQVKRSQHQATYDEIAKGVKEQLRVQITERKIFSLDFTKDKKKWHAEVGQLDPQQGRYEILAIFESKPHIIFTRTTTGTDGLTILVSNDEITGIEDFD
jgi:hypothetical protein